MALLFDRYRGTDSTRLERQRRLAEFGVGFKESIGAEGRRSRRTRSATCTTSGPATL